MKYFQFAFLIFFLFSFLRLSAQQNHFIYIQTENKQPFYVKLDKKLYSSTASGYLVMPKLKEGPYKLAIGFPKSEWTEQKMVCAIEGNDMGYLLKNFDGKGWGLLNLQTSALIMASDSVKYSHAEVVNNTDAFSNMLSNVVNDSTIRQTEIAREQVKKAVSKEEETALPGEGKEKEPGMLQATGESPKEDTVTAGVNKAKTEPGTTKEVEKEAGLVKEQASPVNSRSAITRSLFNKNSEGTEMVFIDEANGKKDTIRVFIPADKNSLTNVEEKPAEISKLKEVPKSEPIIHEEQARDTAGLVDTELPGQNKKSSEKIILENKATDNKDTGKVQANDPAGKPAEAGIQKTPMINSDCKSYASDADFLKLRKKMVAEDNDDDMVGLAKKIFKSKCFTVEQVKNLSALFLKDSGKYAFFDMAYPFVSDSHNFNTLQNQLSEVYYINRFQSMIHH